MCIEIAISKAVLFQSVAAELNKRIANVCSSCRKELAFVCVTKLFQK